MSEQPTLFGHDDEGEPVDGLSYQRLAEEFCSRAPYRLAPLSKRNWGGPLHSLCSYQGKLKPSIAHVLVKWFTAVGDTVYDPMSGVGTIPLEARRQGRVGIGNDLSPLAYAVTSAKVERIDEAVLAEKRRLLGEAVERGCVARSMPDAEHADWGLNRPIAEYFHPDTLQEVLLARHHLLEQGDSSPEANLVRASVMHVLHGNRPYALSRRSHPVTPFAPTGPIEYRSLLDRLDQRLASVVPLLTELAATQPDGLATLDDFRRGPDTHFDALITSPPFSKSLRFWSSNWMRLWFAGWAPENFQSEPTRYLETEQRLTYEPYRDFASSVASRMRPGARLIFHLGETKTVRMTDEVAPLLAPYFDVVHVGREDVGDTESHGLTDKGATIAHWYLFAERSKFDSA